MIGRPPATPLPRARNARGSAILLLLAISACAGGGAPKPGGDPAGDPGAAPTARARIPARYVLVGPGGATVYTRPGQPAPDAQRLLPGFGYAVTEERVQGTDPQARFLRLHDGRWLAAGDVVPARPSSFAGDELGPGADLRFGWTVVSQATVHAAPTSGSLIAGARPMHSRVRLTGACRRGWCPLEGGWIRAADVRLPALASRPDAIRPGGDRWIDIDLGSQTLVAYEGDRPVYATLVSAGVGAPGTTFATPPGTWAVRSKHQLARMDNLEYTGVVPYAYDVPLTQYFNGGKALHAALWHDRFGHPMSHGCVNVAPRDAEWLFAFTSPALPEGDPDVAAAPPTRPGTFIHVRPAPGGPGLAAHARGVSSLP